MCMFIRLEMEARILYEDMHHSVCLMIKINNIKALSKPSNDQFWHVFGSFYLKLHVYSLFTALEVCLGLPQVSRNSQVSMCLLPFYCP